MSSRKRSNQLRARALRSSITDISMRFPNVHPPSLRANGSRHCAPDDRLREAIHRAAQRKNGLLKSLKNGVILPTSSLKLSSKAGRCLPPVPTRNDGLTLRAEIAATLVAAVTVHAHPGDAAGALDPLPDKARKILQRRRSKRVDVVEQFVIEHFPHLGHASFEQAEVQHHACRGIGHAAHGHLGAERVAVDFLACRTQRRSGQRMRGLEAERFRQFPHLKESNFYLIPSALWVCRLS